MRTLTKALAVFMAAAGVLIPQTATAKSASQLRIYIDPGHGGYTSIDRPLPIINHSGGNGDDANNPDTVKFYESNTNLQKAFGVMEKLIEMGFSFDRSKGARNFSNNIVMSRNANWETNLATVREETDVNNIDMFLSIHSNAPGNSEPWNVTNYPLMLYRGYTSPRAEYALDYNLQVQSREMCWKLWRQIIENPHHHWNGYNTESTAYISGDIDFYRDWTISGTSKGDAKGYLGVLRHHVPGLLAEGYFHTYGPSRHRAMNWDVDRVEGAAYARGIADYFGIPRENTGIIYGIIRDGDQTFWHSEYDHTSINNDKYLPLNGVKVTLRKGSYVVAEYSTDDHYNGAFVFTVEPGTYEADFVLDGYQDQTQTFTVGASRTIYPEVMMHKGNSSYRPLELNYPDPLKDTGIRGADSFSVRAEYSDVDIPGMSGRWPRRVFARNGLLYIMGVQGGGSNPILLVYDTRTRRVVRELSQSGMILGGARPIGDMALTADGHVVVCTEQFNQFNDNQASQAGVSRGRTRFYYWNNDLRGLPTGSPVELFSSTMTGNFYRANAGHAFSYSGTLANGRIVQSCINAYPGSSNKIFYNIFNVRNRVLKEEGMFANTVSDDYSTYSSLGELFTMVPSPGHPDYICFNSRQNQSRQYYVGVDNYSHNLNSWCHIPDASLGQGAYGAGYFRFGNVNYMVVPDNDANGKNSGVKLLDCGDYGNAVRCTLSGAGVETKDVGGYVAAHGEGVALRDGAGNITDGYINLYLVRDGKLTKYTSRKDATQRREMAYGLDGELTQFIEYTCSYSLTGDAENVDIVIRRADGTGNEIVAPQGAQKAGEHTVALDIRALGLEDCTYYNWSVRVRSAAIPSVSEWRTIDSGQDTEGGVVPITDPDKASFGFTVVTHGANGGLDIWDAAGNRTADHNSRGHSLYGDSNGYNSMRGAEMDGMAVNCSWGSAGAGLIAFDPIWPNGDPWGLYYGTKDSNGSWTHNGQTLYGCPSGAAFTGSGDNMRLYAFSWSAGNKLLRYDIGAERMVSVAPTVLGDYGVLKNTNVDVIPAHGGLFLSQVRYAPNNAADCPAFIYVGPDNQVKLNSAAIPGLSSSSSGLAVSKDEKTLAVADAEGNIKVYDIAWNGDTPVLTHRYDFATGAVSTFTHMRFDYAGNLHTYQKENRGYHAYALPDAAPVVTTPAARTKTIYSIHATGVEDVSTDAAGDAPVRFFNLSGVEMPAGATLSPGVYVRLTGDKAEKIVVR